MSDTALKSGDTSTVTIVFSEAVAGFSNDDITVVNGTLSTMSSSDDITWTGTYTPSSNVEDSTNVLTLGTSWTDKAGNAYVGSATETANFTIDTKTPTISAVTQVSTPSNDTTPSYIFTTNEAGTITTNITQGISSDTSASVGNNTVTFNTLPEGTYANKTITLTDSAGNSSSLTLATFVIDTTPPTISEKSFTTDDQNNNRISVTFSEAVFNTNGGSGALEASDFTLSISNNGAGSATLSSTTPSSISKDGNKYTLGYSLSGTANNGQDLTVNPSSATAIYDSVGNAAAISQSNNTGTFS